MRIDSVPSFTPVYRYKPDPVIEGVLAAAAELLAEHTPATRVPPTEYRPGDPLAGGAASAKMYDSGTARISIGRKVTSDLREGVELLSTTPFQDWPPSRRMAFVQAHWALLHEVGHVALPTHDAAGVAAFLASDRGIEEGLTELVTTALLPELLHRRHGITLTAADLADQYRVSAYTREQERLRSLLEFATDGSEQAVARVAGDLADATPAEERPRRIAELITSQVAGTKADPRITELLARIVPEFVGERSGRTPLAMLVGALRDIGAGHAVDVDALLVEVGTKFRPPKTTTGAPAGTPVT